MNKYTELFVTESRDYLTAMEHALLQLEADPTAQEAIDSVFRSVHTLKGMSGVMGYAAVTELSHAMETRLARVRAGEESLGRETIDILFEGSDVLGQAVQLATTGEPGALDVASLVRRIAGQAAER
ncbi:MAG: Hpt domain-containing protein, partial [Cytophagaceae bacterium]|nr:Hpt domain-containing protein [Gemmatimonadaceae bacterium]